MNLLRRLSLIPALLLVAIVLLPAAARAADPLTPTLGDPVRLSDTEAGGTRTPATDTDGTRTFAAWYELGTIRAARLDVAGGTMGVKHTFDRAGRGASAEMPDVAVSGEHVYVTWVETGGGGERVVVAASHDGGHEWTIKEASSTTPYWHWYPHLDADGDRVWVTWTELDDDGGQVMAAGSRDGGATFPCRARISSHINDITWLWGDVAVDGDHVHFAWTKDPYKVLYRRSADDGRTLDAPQVLEGDEAAGTVRIAADEGHVIITHGIKDVIASTSSDAGATFAKQSLWGGEDLCKSYCPGNWALKLRGETAIVAWTFHGEAYVARSLNGGESFGGTQAIGPAIFGFHADATPSIAIAGDAITVAYTSAPSPPMSGRPTFDLDPFVAVSGNRGDSYTILDLDQEPGYAVFPAAVAAPGPAMAGGAAWWRTQPENLMSVRQVRFRNVALAPPDLKVVSAVPTQGTDDPARLVAGRPTAVRVKVRSSAPRTLTVALRVTATFQTPGGEVTRTAEKDVVLRGGQTSFQHVGFDGVPEAGTMKVTAELDPDEHQPDADRTNNAGEAQRPVVAAKRFHVLFVPVRSQSDDPIGCGRVQRVAAGAERFLKASWPIDPRRAAFDVDCSNPWAYPDGLDDAGVAGVFNDLDMLTLLGDYDRVVAVVPDGWFSRLGAASLHNAAGMAPYDTLGRSAIVEARAMGGWVTAHEIAHELGWASAAAGTDGHLVQTPAQGYWVTEKRQILDDIIDAEHPTATLDELRDDTARWTSDLTWDFLSARLNDLAPSGPGLTAAAAAPDGPVLAVSGIATDDGATLSSVAAVDGTPDADDPTGDLTLEQRDAAGAVLATQRLRSGRLYGSLGVGADVPHQPTASAPFTVRAPLATGAASLRLKRGATVLAQRAKSAHAPAVTVTAPAAGATVNVGGPLKITWDATDADGDAVRSSVELSTDGTTWKPVGVDLAGGALTITATAALSGDAVRLRVVTTDGWQTTSAESGTFTVRGGLSDGRIVTTGGAGGQFHTAEADGSDLQTLPVKGWWPSWSPDGRRLAFHAGDCSAICTAAADGSDKRVVAPGGSYYARWVGPETVAFFSSGESRAGWYTVHDDPSKDYTKFPTAVGMPCDLSLDGSLLLLRQNESLAVANADGSGAKKIPTSSMRYTGDACGSLSPDATMAVAEDYDDIAVWDVATGKRTNLTNDGEGKFPRDEHPVFSPSGKWIYYVSTRDRQGDNNDIWRMRPDGTGNEKILDGDRNHNHIEDGGDVSYDWVEIQPRYLTDDEPVAPAPPVADAGGPYTVDEGMPVTLDAAGSKPGKGGAAITARDWDLDGDGAYDDAAATTAQRTFADDGAYAPGLLVTAADGLTRSTAAQVVVRNVAPSLHDVAVAPTVDDRIAAAATIADPGADDTFTATVDWHDGEGPRPAAVVQDAGGRRVVATHDPVPGATTVTIRVTDDDGGASDATAAIAAPPANGAPALEASTVAVAYGQDGTEFTPDVSDPENDAVQVSVVTAPEHGTVIARRPAEGDVAPRLTYRPEDGFAGTDQVVLRATDGSSTTGPVAVTFQVAGPPETPAPTPPGGPAGELQPRAPVAGAGNRTAGASAPSAGASLDAVVRPVDAIALRGAKRCVSRRSFPVRIVRPKALAPYRRVRVRVNGKVVRDVRKPSKAARASIDLRGLPKGRVAIDVEVTLASGRVIHQQRAYRTCTPKRAVKRPTKRTSR